MTIEKWMGNIGIHNIALQRAEVVERALRMAWQASRENQQEYQEHEFCQDIGCAYAPPRGCRMDAPGCVRTTKEFYHWLEENGYKIVKDKKS